MPPESMLDSPDVETAVRQALTETLGEDWTGRSVEEGMQILRSRLDAMDQHRKLLEQLVLFRSQSTPLALKDGDPMPAPVAMLCRIIEGIFVAHPEAKNYISFGWSNEGGQGYVLEARRADGESPALAAKRLKADLAEACDRLKRLLRLHEGKASEADFLISTHAYLRRVRE